MDFRNFISNWRYRRRAEAEFARFHSIQPPKNPSRRYIDNLVRRLLDERKSPFARKELEMIGAVAVPSLVAALQDERFRTGDRAGKSWSYDPPLHACLELLVQHDPESMLAVAIPLGDSPSSEVRKTVALHVASLGEARTLAVLAKLLQDDDGYVRSYVAMGVDRACSSGRATSEFRAGTYDLLLPQCDQEWAFATNEAAKIVIALDQDRAAVDFASARWLAPSNPNVHRIIEACTEANILLPESLLRPLLEHAMVQAVGERCYPFEYIAAAALDSLALSQNESVRPLLVEALDHEQEQIQEAAAQGLARLAGLDDPVQFVYKLVEHSGLDALTPPQRTVYFANIFDGEVCNGGIMQFFGNSSGDHVREVLAALQELGHAEAERALATAVDIVGPLAYEQEREVRLAAFEGKFDDMGAAFEPLESAFYETTGRFRQMILLYAAEHAKHFATH